MWALGVDTAGVTQSVVLLHSDGRRFIRQSAERRQQGDIVQEFVAQCLAEAGITLKDIGVLAAVTGPGSFTGLRIGLALLQGYARALNCPLTGYDRFTLLRFTAADAVIVLESLRAELFVQLTPGQNEMLSPADILPRLTGRAVVGDGAVYLGIEPLPTLPEAELAARHALADVAAGRSLLPAIPHYVRPPDVTFPKAQQ